MQTENTAVINGVVPTATNAAATNPHQLPPAKKRTRTDATAKAVRVGKTWTARLRRGGHDVYETGHKTRADAELAAAKELARRKAQGEPFGKGPKKTSFAHALRDYAKASHVRWRPACRGPAAGRTRPSLQDRRLSPDSAHWRRAAAAAHGCAARSLAVPRGSCASSPDCAVPMPAGRRADCPGSRDRTGAWPAATGACERAGSRAKSSRLGRELAGGVRKACRSRRSVGSSSGSPCKGGLETATALLPRLHAGYA